MEDIGTQFRGILSPITVDLPADSRRPVAVLATPPDYRIMAYPQLFVWPYVRGCHRQTGRGLGVNNFANGPEPCLRLDAAFNIDQAVVARAINHHIVTALPHAPSLNGVINLVQSMPELTWPLRQHGRHTDDRDRARRGINN